MIDIAARATYHIARANVNIGVVRQMVQNRPHHEPLMVGYATSEPCLCASFAGTGEVTGNCSTVAC